MTGSTAPTGPSGRPAPDPRSLRPGLRRLAAGVWLAAVLASAAGEASATASTGAAPYSITEIGSAPATGFSISDIGAVPTHGLPVPAPPTLRQAQ